MTSSPRIASIAMSMASIAMLRSAMSRGPHRIPARMPAKGPLRGSVAVAALLLLFLSVQGSALAQTPGQVSPPAGVASAGAGGASSAPNATAKPAPTPEAAPAPPANPDPAGGGVASPGAVPPGEMPANNDDRLGPQRGYDVMLADELIVTFFRGLGHKSAEQRASAATERLKSMAAALRPEEIALEGSVAGGPERITVFAGKQRLFELTEEDARASGEDSAVDLGQTVQERLRDALRREKRRSAAVQTAFSLALTVFLALIAVYLVRKVRSISARVLEWLEDHPDRVRGLRLMNFEVLGANAARSGLFFAVGIGRVALQLGIAYAYLITVFSLFESTRGLTTRLTNLVLAPLSAITTRLAEALPALLVGTMGAIAVFLVVRLVGLFFVSVERGESDLPLVPRDLARPLSVMLQASIVLFAIVFGAPVVTGDPESPLSRLGILALVCVTFALVPLLATAVVGLHARLSRRLRVGALVEVGALRGRLVELGLLELRLLDSQGAEVRFPHLLTLLSPTRVVTTSRGVECEMLVPATISEATIQAALSERFTELGQSPRLYLEEVNLEGRLYVVVLPAHEERGYLGRVADALTDAKIPVIRLSLRK